MARVVILGAGGRDFHNFNVCYRTADRDVVVAFTAAQIPNIAGRRYPAALAGPRYPDGIPIVPEAGLAALIRRERIDDVVFAYSDVSHEYVMHLASIAMAAGAGVRLLGPRETMLTSRRPVVAVCAVRTGAGKSATARRVAAVLRGLGRGVAVIRHPMAYGDLARQAVQRFANDADLAAAEVTIEEREEYEPHLTAGSIVYAGVDYAAVLARAETEADAIVWDGGNNDFPFIRPDLYLVVADPHRAGDELRYHPGEVNVRAADAVIINKVDTARPDDVARVRANVAAVNPTASIIEAASPISVDDSALLPGRRAVVVEDGPTVTHGGMAYGAGAIAAERHGAVLVDPRDAAVGAIREIFAAYPHLHRVIPAMGYGADQLRDLETTLDRVPADVIVIGTPVDLRRLIRLTKPAVRVTYGWEQRAGPAIETLVREMLARRPKEGLR